MTTDREPVAWRIRCGGQNLWSYAETEADADFYIKSAGTKHFEKQPLYSAAALEQERALAKQALELAQRHEQQAVKAERERIKALLESPTEEMVEVVVEATVNCHDNSIEPAPTYQYKHWIADTRIAPTNDGDAARKEMAEEWLAARRLEVRAALRALAAHLEQEGS